MKGIALALVVLFIAFVVVYNVDGSWIMSFLENLSALRGDSFFEFVRDRLSGLAVNPFDSNSAWYENVLNALTYVCKLISTPIEILIAFIQWLVTLIETAFGFFPTT